MRRILGALAVAAALAISGASSAVAKTCSGRYVHGVVGGQQKCLGSGEYCARRFEKTYEHYGFVCDSVRGTYRLEKR